MNLPKVPDFDFDDSPDEIIDPSLADPNDAKEETVVKPRPVNDVGEFNSQVDIIVPFHGQYEQLMTLIESIFRLTRSNYYQLCLVDDASPNPEFIKTVAKNAHKNSNRLQQQNVLKALRCGKQKGFAGACKYGYDNTSSPYVCFVNSDVVIEDSGWLRAMGESLLRLKGDGVRMVAPTTNNPVGGHEAQKGEKFVREQADVVIEDESFLSLYCFMCHRELFPRIGGFLKEYPYGYYEDEEIAARMRKNGFKQAVCRSSWVRHEGMSTIRSIWRENTNIRDVMEKDNRQRCIDDLKKLK